jgi:hypothetical protein
MPRKGNADLRRVGVNHLLAWAIAEMTEGKLQGIFSKFACTNMRDEEALRTWAGQLGHKLVSVISRVIG